MKGSSFFAAAMAAALAAAALAGERNTARGNPDQTVLAAGGEVSAGCMVCVWTNGLAYAAADTNALAGARVVGVAANSAAAGGGVLALRGAFLLDNAAGALTAKDIGSVAYVAGPAAVTTQAGASQDIAAGKVSGFEPRPGGTNDAVWVNITL